MLTLILIAGFGLSCFLYGYLVGFMVGRQIEYGIEGLIL